MRLPLPIDPHALDVVHASALEEMRRRHLERLAADEGYRAVTEEWRLRWEARQENER